MAIQYSVAVPELGSAPVFQLGDQNPGVTVKCLGDSELWLAQTPTVDESNGYVLSPGSSVVWEAGKALFLGGKAGGRAFISDNSGALFDASAVASSMIQQDLAGKIAESIRVEGIPPVRQSTIPIPEVSFITDGSPANPDGTKLYVSDWFDSRKADMLYVRGGVDSRDGGFPYNFGVWRVWARWQQEGSGVIEDSREIYEIFSGPFAMTFRCQYQLGQVVVSFDGLQQYDTAALTGRRFHYTTELVLGTQESMFFTEPNELWMEWF